GQVPDLLHGELLSLVNQRPASEGDVVLHVVEVPLLRRRGTSARELALRLLRWPPTALHVLVARTGRLFARAAEQLQTIAADLGRVALLAVLGVLARAQAALDVGEGPLLQVLSRDLRDAAEERDPVPFRRFLLLAGCFVL